MAQIYIVMCTAHYDNEMETRHDTRHVDMTLIWRTVTLCFCSCVGHRAAPLVIRLLCACDLALDVYFAILYDGAKRTHVNA